MALSQNQTNRPTQSSRPIPTSETQFGTDDPDYIQADRGTIRGDLKPSTAEGTSTGAMIIVAVVILLAAAIYFSYSRSGTMVTPTTSSTQTDTTGATPPISTDKSMAPATGSDTTTNGANGTSTGTNNSTPGSNNSTTGSNNTTNQTTAPATGTTQPAVPAAPKTTP